MKDHDHLGPEIGSIVAFATAIVFFVYFLGGALINPSDEDIQRIACERAICPTPTPGG